MSYKEFGEVNEQSILDNCPKVIGDVKKEFGLLLDEERGHTEELNSFGNGESRGYARVLAKDNTQNFVNKEFEPSINEFENNKFYGGGFSDAPDIRKTSGTSYVLVVAALIALVAIVYVVTTTILNMVDVIA